MTRFPSYKTLEAAFPGQCFNGLSCQERVMCALNEILEGHGTEAVWGKNDEVCPMMEYVNMGATYATTMLYDYERGTYSVMSWGDWVERNEKRIKE